MSFISAFDVMGPNMIGPSSSHTAGAARIAFLARKMLNGTLKKVQFTLYGSFAKTYHGHGTDRALLGGIMGFGTDDMRIRDSFEIAKDIGLDFSFVPNEIETDIHPNTVDILMTNENGDHILIRGESLGGGKARICRIYDVEVDQQKLILYGCLAVEMETSALYMLAARYNVQALGVFTVSNHLFTGEETTA